MTFTERDVAVLAALAEVILPGDGALPGAAEVGVARRLQQRSGWWRPTTTRRVRALVAAWEWSPAASRRLTRFTRLSPAGREAWVASSYRSRNALLRLVVTALKQLILLEWAAAPQVARAIGYDDTCRADEPERAPEPADYVRPGPAVARGAVPRSRLSVTSPRPRAAGEELLETVTGPELGPGHRRRCDAVVVGSGAGGAVAAAVLAEAGLDVVVLEEGPHLTTESFTGPVFDRFQRMCRDDGTTQIWGRPPIPLPLGRVVGGTTVVNSGTCFRTPDRVLRAWDQGWGTEVSGGALDPYFEAIESFLDVRPVPWPVLGPNGAAVHRGAVALGLSGGPILRNISGCRGCGQCAFGCPTGAKQAMHVSYLPRAGRAGATVVAQARVERIVHDGTRARGVTGSFLDARGRPQGAFTIDAEHVVLCAGAIHTPALLAASRVPDPSGQTGRNLRIHPATGVGGFFAEDMTAWKGTLQSYFIDALFDSHEVMFEATATLPGIGAGSLPGLGTQVMRDIADLRRFVTLGFYVSDTSKGRVRRLPGGEVVATYRMNELDARRMGTAVALAAEVLLAAGARRVLPGIPGIESISARPDLEALRERRLRPEHLKLSAFHPMGTVRMGADPARAVVDPWGRHHALGGLCVADASLFPSCAGVNPQITIMALAARAAQRLANG